MKLNAKVVKAVKGNKAVKTAKTVKVIKATVSTAIALLTGKRGITSRLVETHKAGESLKVRALQNNLGLSLKGAPLASVEKGILKGKRDALLPLGGYVNGKMSGARVEFVTPAQFAARSKPCIVHWSADDNGIQGRYIGNPNQKGMVAVSVQYGKTAYYWQMEQDSNANNKHERGSVQPIKGQKLVAC